MAKSKRKSKRVLLLSDSQCGHILGLTPPDFDAIPTDTSGKRYKLYLDRRRMWKWFVKKLEPLKPIDILIFNGDAIEGKGDKSGGTELLTTDRVEQTDMATVVIEQVDAKETYMSYGTPYHAGRYEDWEDIVAANVGAAKIGGEDSLSVGWQDVPSDGLIINYRHHVGRSSIPHGKATPLLKQKLWNGLWSLRGEYPLADVIVRSHVHYAFHTWEPGGSCFITPALCGYGSKFGARICLGEVHFGFMWLDVTSKKEWTWDWEILKLKNRAATLLAARQ